MSFENDKKNTRIENIMCLGTVLAARSSQIVEFCFSKVKLTSFKKRKKCVMLLQKTVHIFKENRKVCYVLLWKKLHKIAIATMHILFYTAKKKQIPKRRNANLLIIHGRTTPEVFTTRCANDHVSLKSKQQNVVSRVSCYYKCAVFKT